MPETDPKKAHAEPADGSQSLAAIEAYLHKQVAALAGEIRQAEGELLPGRIEALGGLARLVEVCRASQPAAPRKRWPVVAALCLTLLVASVLFFVRVPRTEIELDVKASEVGFELQSSEIIADAMQLNSLGAAGMREIEIPAAGEKPGRVLTDAALRLSTIPGQARSMLNLAAVALPAGTRVWIRKLRTPRHYKLSFRQGDVELRADVQGVVRLAASGAPAAEASFDSPAGILLRTGREAVDLDLELAPAAAALSPQMPAANLSFFEVDRYFDPRQSVAREVSTVQQGTLYFESLDGAERKLRPGEGLRFGSSRGEIRSAKLDDDAIAMLFHGEVRELSTGSTENRRSLMPTLLEWLRARHGMTLLWGTGLYLFTVIGATMRWWGIQL